MHEQGPPGGAPAPGGVDVVRARRVEVVDDSGEARIVLGRLGEGEGAVFGVSVLAGEPATGVHLTADRSSAGVALSCRGDGVVDLRTYAGDDEVAASVDVGAAAGGPLLSVEVARDGSVTVLLREAAVRRE